MSEMKHTPGPWRTDEADHDSPYQDIRILGNGRAVAELWIDDAPVPDYNAEQRANARLIAAAPELLEAAKLALAMLNRSMASEESCGQPFNGDDEHEAHRVLTAAIAKATAAQEPTP